MIVVCAQCSKRYHLDRVSLGEKGRQVRCAACRYLWFQAPEPLALTVDPPPPPAAAPGASRYRKIWRTLLFSGGILFIFGGFIWGRSLIIARFPEARLFYEALGFQSPNRSFSVHIRHMHMKRVVFPGEKKDGVVLTGDVVNTGVHTQNLPVLKIQLFPPCPAPRTPQTCVPQVFEHHFSQGQILPGEILHFEISVKQLNFSPDSFAITF